MKPSSTEWRNVKRRLFRRYRKTFRKYPVENFYLTKDQPTRSRLFELFLLSFFLEGMHFGEEIQILLNNSKNGIVESRPQIRIPLRPNIDHFHASDIPIFVIPEIFDLLQESIIREARLKPTM